MTGLEDLSSEQIRRLYTTQLSDAELAIVFPEAGEIIQNNIKEYMQQRDRLVATINKELAEYDDLPEGKRWFWIDWTTNHKYKDELEFIDKSLARLKRGLRAIKGQAPANGLTDDLIRQAKEIPVESVIDQQFRRTGSTLVGLCPFHAERTPSFHIFSSNRGKCFGGCGKGGDVIDIYMLLQNCSFKEAVFALAGGQS